MPKSNSIDGWVCDCDVALPSLGRYDLIFGRKYLVKYGLCLDFKQRRIIWDNMVLWMPLEDEVVPLTKD